MAKRSFVILPLRQQRRQSSTVRPIRHLLLSALILSAFKSSHLVASAFISATNTNYPGGSVQPSGPCPIRPPIGDAAKVVTRSLTHDAPQSRASTTTSLNLFDAASIDIDDTSTKAAISLLLAAAAVAGALLANSSDDSSAASTSLDEKYTDPTLIAEEYKARKEGLKITIKREEELAAAEERGEYSKERADVKMTDAMMAEAGSDPAGIQAPSEELEVRQMVVEQKESEEKSAFDHDISDTGAAATPTVSTDSEADARFSEGLKLLEMAEAAKAADEARGKMDVAMDISKPDSKIEQQARDILRIEFAAMEDRKRKEAEDKRIKDLEEGQRLLDLATAARKADTDRLTNLLGKDNTKMEADAAQLEDQRLQFELEAAQNKFGMSGDVDIRPVVGAGKVGEYEATEEELEAKAKAQQELADKQGRYLKESVEREARANIEKQIELDADMFEKERLGIEKKVAERRTQDESANRVLEEEMASAKLKEAERAMQRQKAEVAKARIEAERATALENKRAEIAKAQIARDMDMVKRYVEEKKEKNAVAMADAEAKRVAKAEAKRVAEEKAAADLKAKLQRTKEEKIKAKVSSYGDVETKNDVPSDVWMTSEEEEILQDARALNKKEGKKREKVAQVFKKRKVVAAGVLYVVGKKLFNMFML